MEYDSLILVINTAVIIFLVALAFLLCLASRFKGESVYAVMIIVVSTIPTYFHDMCHRLQWDNMAFILTPLCYSVDLTLMPFLWFLSQRGFNPQYSFKATRLLHFLPAALFFIVVYIAIHTLSMNEIHNFIQHKAISRQIWLSSINFVVLMIQMVIYFFIIFRYLRQVRDYVRDNYSEMEFLNKLWIPRLITFFGAQIIVAVICYNIWPATQQWLFYLLNLITIGYLIYQVLLSAMSRRDMASLRSDAAQPLPAVIIEKTVEDVSSRDDADSLRQHATQMVEFLHQNELFTDPRLTLNDVAKQMEISPRKLSNAINAVLDKTFFELINGMRIEKAKTLLLIKQERGLTLETIAEMSGFNSQVTLCNAFKRIEGITTTQWLKQQ